VSDIQAAKAPVRRVFMMAAAVAEYRRSQRANAADWGSDMAGCRTRDAHRLISNGRNPEWPHFIDLQRLVGARRPASSAGTRCRKVQNILQEVRRRFRVAGLLFAATLALYGASAALSQIRPFGLHRGNRVMMTASWSRVENVDRVTCICRSPSLRRRRPRADDESSGTGNNINTRIRQRLSHAGDSECRPALRSPVAFDASSEGPGVLGVR